MRDVVIVPAYFRPEFLYLCLESLSACPEMVEKDVWIYHDQKFGDTTKFAGEWEETRAVTDYWNKGFGNRIRCILRPENGFYGNSYNVLAAYSKALEEGTEKIYLVEDDVLVSTDFFRWHDAVQKDGDYFCSVAGHCERNIVVDEINSSEGYFKSEQYASLGVAWKRENLELVVQHAVRDYYQNNTIYILRKFPKSKLGTQMMEQDGLIQRVMEQTLQQAAWPHVPRAYHVGVFGYHRGIGPENMMQGTLAEKIEKYRAAIMDKEWIEKVAYFQTDIKVLPKAIPAWNRLILTN